MLYTALLHTLTAEQFLVCAPLNNAVHTETSNGNPIIYNKHSLFTVCTDCQSLYNAKLFQVPCFKADIGGVPKLKIH